MTISFGSGQTSGLPLAITAITQGTRQLLHTAVSGTVTPQRIKINAQNVDTVPHTLNIALEDAGATVLRQFSLIIPPSGELFPAFSQQLGQPDLELVLNGACTLKVWADTASVLMAYARVDNQTAASGGGGSVLASGLVAAVQNSARFAVNAQGGTGQSTETNANIIMPGAYTLNNLVIKADSAIANGATVTVAVRKNGASSLTLTNTLANADGTTAKVLVATDSGSQGDLVCFDISCNNAGAPTANIHGATEVVLTS